jgi:ergothioneine biosynthesis protein EgtB
MAEAPSQGAAGTAPANQVRVAGVATLADLAKRYREVRAATEALTAPLSEADCTAQSMADASPAKWHLAHTSWFFETFALERFAPGYEAFDPGYRNLFNSYYNSVGAQFPRPQRGLVTRPGLAEVLRYRATVDAAVLDLLAEGSAGEVASVVELGLHHEQQHQELILTDVKHLLSHNPLLPAYRAQADRTESGQRRGSANETMSWYRFEEAPCEIGHGDSDAGFAFDNECPRHRILLGAFELASRPVSNADWCAFIEDGGYRRSELWLSDGWMRVCEEGWEAPLYWSRDGDGDGWRHFTLRGLEPLQASAPVCHVSQYEADAFATWADARLPTEFEWEVAARRAPLAGIFAESGLWQPGCGDAGTGLEGPDDLFGNVWEWTASAYLPYPRYRPPSGALGEYNGKFMSGQLVLRGGSVATPRSHIRATYRNFFPPAARWQFSGLRLARDAS